MKNIKYFKYKNIYEFNLFLKDYGYRPYSVVGFSFSDIKRYHGNILKTYKIYFDDGEYEYFSVVYFKSFNEYQQAALGFNGERLNDWYQQAYVIKYKVKDVYGIDDSYVITTK